MDGPWKPDILAMVQALELEISEARQRIEAEREAESQKREQEKLEREEAIRLKYLESRSISSPDQD